MANKDKVGAKGFFRVQLTENGEVKGDSGWKENQVTNLGINQYIVNWVLGDTASGKSVSHMALGTSTDAPASNATSLTGEVTNTDGDGRQAVSTSVVASRTAQFTAAFNSADSWIGSTHNIANVGLFNTSAETVGTMLAGNTFTSSAVATNQNVQVTYQLRFS
jgi:hypothetical protein